MSKLETEAEDTIAIEDARLNALKAEEAASLPILNIPAGKAYNLAISLFT